MLFDHNFRRKSEGEKMKKTNENWQNIKNYNIHNTINVGIQIEGNFLVFSVVVVKILYLYNWRSYSKPRIYDIGDFYIYQIEDSCKILSF